MQSLVARPARKTGRRPFFLHKYLWLKIRTFAFEVRKDRRSQKTKVRLRDLGMNLFSRGSDWAIVAFRGAKGDFRLKALVATFLALSYRWVFFVGPAFDKAAVLFVFDFRSLHRSAVLHGD